MANTSSPPHLADPPDDSYWCRDHRGTRYTLAQSLALIREFHGHAAPGVFIGTKMVSLAMERLPEGILFDALSETASCLPDAVQMLTPCTIGNQWLRIKDLGRYAVILYDKATGIGARVALDPERLKAWPEFYAWFYKRKEKKDQNVDLLMQEISLAGQAVLAVKAVIMKPSWLVRRSKGKIATCPLCGEAFPASQGSICRGCQGETPWEAHAIDKQEEPALRKDPAQSAIRRLGHRPPGPGANGTCRFLP